MFIAKVSLLITKCESVYQSFVLVVCDWEMNPDQDAHQILIYFKRIGGMQSMQKYLGISTWP